METTKEWLLGTDALQTRFFFDCPNCGKPVEEETSTGFYGERITHCCGAHVWIED